MTMIKTKLTLTKRKAVTPKKLSKVTRKTTRKARS